MKHSALMIALAACLVSGAAAADPRGELVDAFQKAMADGSYRMDIQTSSGPDTMLEVQLPFPHEECAVGNGDAAGWNLDQCRW